MLDFSWLLSQSPMGNLNKLFSPQRLVQWSRGSTSGLVDSDLTRELVNLPSQCQFYKFQMHISRPGCDAGPSLPSSAEVKNRVELYYP